LALLLLVPILLPTLRLASTTHFAEAPRATVAAGSLDVLGLVLPNSLNPILGGGRAGICIALGYGATFLAIMGLRHAGARRTLWLTTGTVALTLALGISLKVGQRQWELPILPYNWIRALPFGKIPRVPFRFFFLFSIAQAIFASWGVERLGSRGTQAERAWGHPRRLYLATSVALLLILLEWWPGYRKLASAKISPIYAALAAGPPGAVCDVPGEQIAEAMYHATAHGRPILGGYVSRHLPDPLVEGVPPIKELWTAKESEVIGLAEPDIVEQPAEALAVLDLYDIRYVVLHKDGSGRPAFERDVLDRILPPEALAWDDGRLLAYKVPHVAPSERRGVAVGFGPGFYAREWIAGTTQRWTSGDGILTLSLLDDQPRRVRLAATLRTFVGSTAVDVFQGEAPAAALTVDVVPRPVEVVLLLNAGYNAIRLVSREPPVRPADISRSTDPRLLSIAVSGVRLSLPSPGEGK
jgi:hypothetical protein